MAEQPGDAYATPQAAIDALRPGWKVTGPGRPFYQTQPGELPGEPNTAKEVGTTYPIQGPNGQPDEITLGPSDKTVVWNTTPGAPLPKALVVIKGPTATPTAGGKPSDPSAWQPVYREPGNASSGLVGQWDPVNSEWHPIAQGAGAQPSGKYEAAIVTLPDGTQKQIGYVDSGDKSFRPYPSDPSKQPSGQMENVYVQNADGSKRLIGITDTGDKSFHPVAADPTTQKRTVQTSTAIYSVDDNDNVKKLIDIDKTVPFQAVVIDGVTYRFDPNEKDSTKSLVQVGPNAPMPKTITQNGVTWSLNPETNKYELPPGVARPTTMTGAGTTSRYLITYDATTGQEISRTENPNYAAPDTQLPQVNTASPMIPAPDPNNPGGWTWVENKGQVLAGDALKNMASVLSGQVVNGKITVDEAKSIMDGANATMQNALTAANTQLDFVSEGARTGAGLLQQRAQTAQGIMGSVLGLAGQGQHYGGGGGTAGLSGGMMAAPAGLGGLLTQGAANYSAELLGGQATMQAAANLVQSADPRSDLFSPTSQAAVATLTQMFDKYAQLNGKPHPAVAGATAAQSSTQNNAMTAPQTAAASTQMQPMGPRADQMYGTTPPGNALASGPGLTGTVPPGSPQYLGFQAPAAPQQQRAPQPFERSVNFNPFTAPVTSGAPTVNLYVGGG